MSNSETLFKVFSRLKAYDFFGLKNKPFRNKSSKMQPIRTKFGLRGHVKGWQCSGNFGRDWPILGEMGAGTSPAEPEAKLGYCSLDKSMVS